MTGILIQCTRSKQLFSCVLLSIAFCSTCFGFTKPVSPQIGIRNESSVNSQDPRVAQSSELLLKMVLELMLTLLDEIEEANSAGLSNTEEKSLSSLAGSLIWGYIYKGIDDSLMESEIDMGINYCEAALVILNDNAQPLSIQVSTRNQLILTVEEILNALQQAI
jgi:hypothetical protein